MRKLLVDGDLLVYRSTVAVEKDLCFDDRYHILMSDETNAWNVMEDTLHELLEQSNLAEAILVFSDPDNNFRKHLSDDYKASRKNSRKPLCYWSIVARCYEEYETKMLPNIEADDTMGLMLTKYPEAFVLWSLDKDLKQIPGLHLIDDEVVNITEDEGDRFFWYQILAGDATDDYFGCKGIGDIRAKRLVDTFENEIDAWDAIVATFVKAKQTKKDALYNAHMARILRHGEYSKGQPILWTSPTDR